MKSVSAEVLEQQGFIHSPRELNGQVGKRFHFIGKLGEGAFGIVFAVIDKLSGKRVALKKIKMSKKCQGIPAFAIRQISILKSISSPYIIKIQEVFYDYELPQLCFVLQYHPHNLHDLIKHNNPLSLKKIKQFTFQIFKTLEYLHSKGIIHRDLKPQNFLITEEQTLCLCDFGQAKYTEFKTQQHSNDISTLWYRAPQILLGCEIYDQKIDVWAAGCIIAEMILGKPLFNSTSQISLIFSIFRLLGTPKIGEFPDIVKMKDFSVMYPKFAGEGINIQGCCRQSLDLLRKILVVNPYNRICVEQALRHQFLLGIDTRGGMSQLNKEK